MVLNMVISMIEIGIYMTCNKNSKIFNKSIDLSFYRFSWEMNEDIDPINA